MRELDVDLNSNTVCGRRVPPRVAEMVHALARAGGSMRTENLISRLYGIDEPENARGTLNDLARQAKRLGIPIYWVVDTVAKRDKGSRGRSTISYHLGGGLRYYLMARGSYVCFTHVGTHYRPAWHLMSSKILAMPFATGDEARKCLDQWRSSSCPLPEDTVVVQA